jgi:ubiquinol-cytochrome c reductase cytochrome b subunit
LLTYLGALRAEEPYVIITQLSTGFYFSYFVLFLPLTGALENKAMGLRPIA